MSEIPILDFTGRLTSDLIRFDGEAEGEPIEGTLVGVEDSFNGDTSFSPPSPELDQLTQQISDARAALQATISEALDDMAGDQESLVQLYATAGLALVDSIQEYASSSSETTPPETGWTTIPPTRDPGTYIWVRTYITRADGSTTVSSPVLTTGNDGLPGEDGANGLQGPPGDDGQSLYTWIRYADTPTSGMSDLPSGKTYIGIAYNKPSPTESSVYSDYRWALIKGTDGIPGDPGEDGQSLYTWVKYATSSAGANMSDDPSGKAYIGLAYNKTTATESTTPGDYKWALIQGEPGADAPIIAVTATTQILTAPATGGATTPATSIVTGAASNTTITAWTYSVNGGTFSATMPPGVSRTDNVVTITGSAMTARTITVKMADAQGISDTLTVAKVLDGAKGDTGNDGAPGADGVGLTNTTVTYAQTASGTTAPTSGWQASVPTLIKGQHLWTRTVWTYTDTSTETGYSVAYVPQDGADGNDGLPGAPGVGITDTTITYAQSTSGTTAPSTGWTAQPPTPIAGRYVWTKTVWTYSDTSTETGYSVGKIGDTGAKGDAGTGITGTTVEYQAGTSGTTAPTGTWVSTVPSVPVGQYLWTKTTTSYTSGSPTVAYSVGRIGQDGANGTPGADGTAGTDGQTSYLHVAYATNSTGSSGFSTSDPSGKTYMGTYTDFTQADSTNPGDYDWVLIKGADGSTGPAGKGIASTEVRYQAGTSATTAPTGTWLTNPPTVPEGQFLWTRTVITFTDTATTTTYAVARQGVDGTDGAAGADAYTVLLTNESHTFPGSTSAALAGSTTTQIIAYKGTTLAPASIGTITGQVTGLTTAITPGTSPTVTITVTTALTAQSGVLVVPVTVDGKTFNRNFSWTVARAGANGTNGTPAPVITLTATTQVLSSPSGGGTTSPATATVTGTAANTTISSWTYSVNGAAFSTTVPAGVSRSGNVVTVTGSTMTARTIAIKMADAAGIADSITVAKVLDGATGSTGSPGSDGVDGADGTDAYTIILSNEAHTFAGSASGATSATAYSEVIAYRGSIQVPATVGSLASIPGMTTTVTNNGTTQTLLAFSVTPSLNPQAGSLSIPITVEGVSFTKEFSWSVSKTGETGVGLTSVVPYYLVQPSAEAIPAQPTSKPPSTDPVGGQSWTTGEPSYTPGTALYRVEQLNYSNDSWSYTAVTPVSSYTAALAAMESANSKNSNIRSTGDASGTVNPQTGAPYIDGDVWWKLSSLGFGGVLKAQWTYQASTNSWRSNPLSHEVIASVDVNKLVVSGSARITQAVVDKIIGDAGYFKSLTADKLAITSSEGLYPDSNLEDPGLSTVRASNSTGWSYNSTAKTLSGSGTFWLTREAKDEGASLGFRVGSKYVIKVWTDNWTQSGANIARKDSNGYSYVTNNSTTFSTFPGGIQMVVDTPAPQARFSIITSSTLTISRVEIQSQIGGVLIEPGGITTPHLATGALNTVEATAMVLRSATILSPSIRTAESGARVEIDTSGFRAYNSSGSLTASITGNSGSFSGVDFTGGTITGALIRTSSGGTRTEISDNSMMWYLDGTSIASIFQQNGSLRINSGLLGFEESSLTLGLTTEISVVKDFVIAPAPLSYSNSFLIKIPLPPSTWQVTEPLFLDGYGKVYRWANAPQRPLVFTGTLNSGTTIAAGGSTTVNVSFSNLSQAPRMVMADMANFPGGSANLSVRVNGFSQTSAILRVANTGNSSATLSGALTFNVFVVV